MVPPMMRLGRLDLIGRSLALRSTLVRMALLVTSQIFEVTEADVRRMRKWDKSVLSDYLLQQLPSPSSTRWAPPTLQAGWSRR